MQRDELAKVSEKGFLLFFVQRLDERNGLPKKVSHLLFCGPGRGPGVR